MDQLKVTATLDAPIVLGTSSYMTLDGILGSVLFDGLQDIDAAHNAIPIKKTGDLYHASAMITEPIDHRNLAFVASLQPGRSINPDLIKKAKTGKIHANVHSSTFVSVLNSYRTITASHASWYVVGDADQIRKLLAQVQFIGKRRASGYGRVLSWDIDGTRTDGLLSYDMPIRPIPVDMFTGDKSLPIVDAAWRPAYWNLSNRAPCYAPSLIY